MISGTFSMIGIGRRDKEANYILQGFKETIRNNAYYIARSCGVKELTVEFLEPRSYSGCTSYGCFKKIQMAIGHLKMTWLGLGVLIHEIAHVAVHQNTKGEYFGHGKLWQNINKKMQAAFGLYVKYSGKPNSYETETRAGKAATLADWLGEEVK